MDPSLWTPIVYPKRVKRLRTQKAVRSRSSTPLHPFLMDRLARVFQTPFGSPVDYGVSPPSTIRPFHLLGKEKHCIDSVITSHDRTLKEWLQLIHHYKHSDFPTEWNLPIRAEFFPFDTMQKVGTYISDTLHYTQKYRMIAWKMVAKLRKRIMDKRIVGDTDLHTLEPIPQQWLVSVYDYKTRTQYQFHTNTIMKSMLHGLLYSAYGIADPKAPKNPYTNMEWNIGQMMILYGQIVRNLSHIHRHPNMFLMYYRNFQYNLTAFCNKKFQRLQVEAAIQFFKDPTTAEVNEIYKEVLEDLYQSNTEYPRFNNHAIMIKNILLRKPPVELLRRWDKLVISHWVWMNHELMLYWSDVDDFDAEFTDVHKKTSEWHLTHPRRIVRRGTTVAT